MLWWMHAILIAIGFLNVYLLHDGWARKLHSRKYRYAMTAIWIVYLIIAIPEMVADLLR